MTGALPQMFALVFTLWHAFSVHAQSLASLAVCSNDTTVLCNATHAGPWSVIPAVGSGFEYLSVVAPANADPADYFVDFELRVWEDGNYTVVVYTPGCVQQATCFSRGAVNVTIHATYDVKGLNQSFSQTLFQTNDYNKYDQIYQGPFNKSANGWIPTVRIAPLQGTASDILMVAQKVALNFVAPEPEPGTSAPSGSNVASASPLPTSGSTSTSTSSSTSIPSSSSHPSSLSLAAKIGLGLGIPLAVLIVTGLVLIIWFFRRRGLQSALARPVEVDGTPSARREMATNANRHEMEATRPPEYHEVDHNSRRGQSEAVELKA